MGVPAFTSQTRQQHWKPPPHSPVTGSPHGHMGMREPPGPVATATRGVTPHALGSLQSHLCEDSKAGSTRESGEGTEPGPARQAACRLPASPGRLSTL